MSTMGLWISGERPGSKKQVKAAIIEAVAMDRLDEIVLEDTSIFSRTGNRTLDQMSIGEVVTFVGPAPHTSRKFYGTITRTDKGFTVR